MMHETDQMLVNEFRALERKIAGNKAKLKKLQAKFKKQRGTLIDRRPRIYSTEFNFVPGDLQAQEQSFTTDGGKVFYCTELASSLRVIGQALIRIPVPPFTLPGQAINVSRPYGVGSVSAGGSGSNYRNEIFDYDWRIVDTSEDREWQNIQQPAPFMGSGSLSGMVLPKAARLRGGAKVLVEINPFFSLPLSGVSSGLFTDVTTFVLHIAFLGFEVRE